MSICGDKFANKVDLDIPQCDSKVCVAGNMQVLRIRTANVLEEKKQCASEIRAL